MAIDTFPLVCPTISLDYSTKKFLIILPKEKVVLPLQPQKR
jgi:hypothetical protein